MHTFKEFIEGNRQTGSTTALVKAAIETKGDIVVARMDNKARLLKLYPELAGHIYTYMDIQNGAWKGTKQCPIFFDTSVVWSLVSDREQATKNPIVVYDGYPPEWRATSDGYIKNSEQINVKLTKADLNDIDNINAEFFEGEITRSTLGRILIHKGIQFYKKLKNNF